MEVATFGQRLKQLRKDIKQEELAHLLGKRGKSTVSAWETDVNFPSADPRTITGRWQVRGNKN